MSRDDVTDVIDSVSMNDYQEPALICSWDEFKNVVTSRRSVRVYTKDTVPEEVINRSIDMGLIAPTSSNLQQTEFYWVRSPDKKSKLVEYCLGQPAAATAAELVVVVARTDTWRRNSEAVLRDLKAAKAMKGVIKYYEKIVPIAYAGGLLNMVKRIYFFAKGLRGVTPREPKSHADLRVWAHKSAALAAENFMLAIRAQGFDTCPMEGHDSLRVNRLLSLPGGAEINMVISVGRRSPSGIYGPRHRLARDLFVFEV